MIYFIQQGKNGPVKVGYTKASAESRLKILQIGSPFPLRLIAEIQGDRKLEKFIHNKFLSLKLHGEWFQPEKRLLNYIQSLREDHFDIENLDGHYYPVIWRRYNGDKCDPCPFCGDVHFHGIGDGHRSPHCLGTVSSPITISHVSGKEFDNREGYIVRSRNQELGERGISILNSSKK